METKETAVRVRDGWAGFITQSVLKVKGDICKSLWHTCMPSWRKNPTENRCHMPVKLKDVPPLLVEYRSSAWTQLNIQCSSFLAWTMNCKKNWRFLFQISCDLALPLGRSALLMDLCISPTYPLSHIPKSLLSCWVWKYSSHKKQRRACWAGKAEENGKESFLQEDFWMRFQGE